MAIDIEAPAYDQRGDGAQPVTSAPAAEPRQANAAAPAKPGKVSPLDPIAAAGQLMVDRVRRLMVVAKDLNVAASQLETLTSTILPESSRAAAPEQAKPPADHFFQALDQLMEQIESRASRVARQAGLLDRVFDLNVKRSA